MRVWTRVKSGGHLCIPPVALPACARQERLNGCHLGTSCFSCLRFIDQLAQSAQRIWNKAHSGMYWCQETGDDSELIFNGAFATCYNCDTSLDISRSCGCSAHPKTTSLLAQVSFCQISGCSGRHSNPGQGFTEGTKYEFVLESQQNNFN